MNSRLFLILAVVAVDLPMKYFCRSSSKGIEWPSGAFGLLRPKSGCPGDKKRGWNEGWRLQDMEDDAKSSTRRSKVSSGSHMDVTLIGSRKDINRTFCMRMEQNTGNRKGNWPNGSYCIYKHKGAPCPMHMDTGWVKWDDEDSYNQNRKEGSLPDGSYNQDTVIRYCCQNAGHWNNSIELPVSRPFYLLTSNSTVSPKCQMIKWALSYLEYIVFDTNDQSNADDEGGKHIFLHQRMLYYCYYQDCRRILSGPSGSFQSHPAPLSAMDPHSQYCSWLITIAEAYVVSLNFTELTIPNCNGMFLRIYDGTNDTAPLLGTYCGSNATIELEISSSENNLYIVSNFGGYGTNPRMPFSFHAQYNAEHSTTECHYEIIGSTGYFKSPMLVTLKDYPRHSNCSWLVIVNDDYLVALNFSLLERQNNDVIEIYDGKNEMATLLARYPPIHGDEKNGTLVSSSSIAYIVLKYGRPSIGNSYTKFVLNYTSEPKPTTTEVPVTKTTRKSTDNNTSEENPVAMTTRKTTAEDNVNANKDSSETNSSPKSVSMVLYISLPIVVLILIIVIILFLRKRAAAKKNPTRQENNKQVENQETNNRTTENDVYTDLEQIREPGNMYMSLNPYKNDAEKNSKNHGKKNSSCQENNKQVGNDNPTTDSDVYTDLQQIREPGNTYMSLNLCENHNDKSTGGESYVNLNYINDAAKSKTSGSRCSYVIPPSNNDGYEMPDND